MQPPNSQTWTVLLSWIKKQARKRKRKIGWLKKETVRKKGSTIPRTVEIMRHELKNQKENKKGTKVRDKANKTPGKSGHPSLRKQNKRQSGKQTTRQAGIRTMRYTTKTTINYRLSRPCSASSTSGGWTGRFGRLKRTPGSYALATAACMNHTWHSTLKVSEVCLPNVWIGLDHHAAAKLAATRLRDHPTVPPGASLADVDAGDLWPQVFCAFEGCMWERRCGSSMIYCNFLQLMRFSPHKQLA